MGFFMSMGHFYRAFIRLFYAHKQERIAMKSIAIVTGASSGVGREFVRQFDAGTGGPLDELWLIARRADALEEVAATCVTATRTFALDLTSPAAFHTLGDALFDACEDDTAYVQWLVNSAGFGTAGSFADVRPDANADMVRLNCLAVVQMCSTVLPYLTRGSRIVNLASMAAVAPLPGFATYAATKAFVLNLSRALDAELAEVGIHVTAVCPKWMKTGFFDRLGDKSRYAHLTGIGFEDPIRAVRQSIRAAILGRPVCVTSPDMKLAYAIAHILPTSCALAAICAATKRASRRS
jgi:short-subunit dehydrogenase